jgi:hypothetical protein
MVLMGLDVLTPVAIRTGDCWSDGNTQVIFTSFPASAIVRLLRPFF